VDTSQYTVLVRPKPEMTRIGVVTFFITTVPVFAVLYWYTAPLGIWPEILAIHLVIAFACLVTGWRQRRVFSAVSDQVLEGNGIFSKMESVPLSSVVRVALVPVFRSHPNEATTQLVVLGDNDQCLFRMRGQFWNDADVTRLVEGINRPTTREREALSEDEFFDMYPGSVYWFERRPVRRTVLVVVAAIAVGVALFVVGHSL
jgi:F0F1-type ATP synthase membrane subunit c/vacuolar-type H+-ATPase subunit K